MLLRAIPTLLSVEDTDDADVSIMLTDDATIHEMNRHYRGVDRPTDVLSFALRDSVEGVDRAPLPSGMSEPLGDIVISVETAQRQAYTHGVALEQEVALLGVHGLLHLLGYEDETEAGAARMRQRERETLGLALQTDSRQ